MRHHEEIPVIWRPCIDEQIVKFLGSWTSAVKMANFLHALDTGQGLLAHTTNRVGVPKILRANI